MSPAVAAVDAYRVRVPFRAKVATAAGPWDAREAWIVVVREDDGRMGVGESNLDDAGWTAAFDAARVDLGPAPANPRWVGVNATVGASVAREAVAAAEAAVAAGFRTLKLKAGPGEEARTLAERLRAVRAAVGDGIALRLDANGTWSLEEAGERLRALEVVALEYVEQPLAPADLEGAAALRARAGARVAADEAVSSPEAARAVLDAGAADVLVVKPGRVGGPAGVARIAALAATRGVPVVVSSMYDTGIGLAAGLWAAAELPDVEGWPAASRDHGLATAGLLVDDLVLEPHLIRDGRMRAAGGSGSGALGVALDEAALARFQVASG